MLKKTPPRTRATACAVVPVPRKRPTVNKLIEALPRAERARLTAACATVELVLGDISYEPGTRLRHAYFPLDGFISLLSTTDPRAQLELGLIGDEGMHGASLALDVAASDQRALVQGAGPALRISVPALRCELRRSPVLRRACSAATSMY